jgi:uncharacterized protein (TIGR02421 family)
VSAGLTDNGISRELLAKIEKKLADNQLVRYKLPANGRLHIDRQLPFLVVHRCADETADVGTGQLLLGEASFLQTTAEPALQANIKQLVHLIAQVQGQHFGAFLVIELWSRESEVTADLETPRSPGFCIMAPEQVVPDRILQTLVHALQAIRLRGRHAKVAIEYQKQPAPVGLPPLFDDTQATQQHVVVFGLEVDAVYRDAQNGAVYPFALKTIRRGLSVALKKTFFAFIREQTRYRPEHYHVLGRRAMTRVVWDVDKQLANISRQFDLLLHVTPVNAGAAWESFQHSHFNSAPEFHYRPRSADPALLKRSLYKAPLERIEDPGLAGFFSSKRDELDRQISLISDRGKPRFLYGSLQLFGEIDDELMQMARQILSQPVDAQSGNERALLSAESMAEHARAELDYYRAMDPGLAAGVEVRDDISGVLVSQGNLLVGTDARIEKRWLKGMLSHEIGTHILTHHNGRQQPFQQLSAGMAGYEALQEGLAVLSEYLVGKLDMPRLRLIAGRVIAVDSVVGGADFVETFRLLEKDYGFAPHLAFTMSMRVHRGGGYTKDMVYLHGFNQLLEYLKSEKDIELLYAGKVALEFLPLLEELRWREVIKPPALIPRYLQQEQSRERLEYLRSHPSLDTILRNTSP